MFRYLYNMLSKRNVINFVIPIFRVSSYILNSATQTVLFEKQAAILSPSLFQQTSNIPPVPLYVFTTFPSLVDHMCKLWSKDPLAKYSPFGLNATEYTGCL